MFLRRLVLVLALATAALCGGASVRAGNDPTALMKLMPSDVPISVVGVDLPRFEKSLQAAVKRITPDGHVESITEQIKKEPPFGEWVDLSKPFGMSILKLQEGGKNSVVWMACPGFAEKAKTVEGGKLEDGIWQFTNPSEGDFFIVAKGEYIAGSKSKEALASLKGDAKPLADAMKDSMAALKDRDVIVRLNLEPIRAMVLQTVGRFGQMVPMMMMMSAQQSGADPANMSAFAGTTLDGVQKLIEQASTLDAGLGVGAESIDLTLAAGFKDGTIKTYLTKQKPAGVALLSDAPSQSFFLASAYHFPGSEAPFWDYFLGKVSGSLPAAAPAGGADGAAGAAGGGGEKPATPSTSDKLRAGLEMNREFNKKVEGGSMLMGIEENAFRVFGTYTGTDTKAIAELASKIASTQSSMSTMFSAGQSYEPSGSRKVGEFNVDEFAIKFDTSKPQMAQAAAMWGKDPRMAIGSNGKTVRYAEGSAQHLTKCFEGKSDSNLTTQAEVKKVLGALPEKRNFVALIDLGAAIPFFKSMMGGDAAKPATTSSAPPIGMSLSLAGEPARVDLHVPIKAIEQVMANFKD